VQRITRTLPILAAVVLIGLAVWLAIEGARKEPGSVAAALGAVAVVVYQRRWEKRQEIDRLHRDKMAPIYEELIDTLKDMERLNDPEKQKEVLNFLNKDLTTKLLLYGPTSLIKEWGTWRTNAAGVTDPADPRILLGYERILLAVRADLGHDNSELAPLDLLRVYINELEESIAAWNAKQAASGQD
jgi:hypothetical protein